MSKQTPKNQECTRCDGRGYLPHFAGIVGGVCFLCGGRKVIPYRKARKVADPKPLAPGVKCWTVLVSDGCGGKMGTEHFATEALAHAWQAARCPHGAVSETEISEKFANRILTH